MSHPQAMYGAISSSESESGAVPHEPPPNAGGVSPPPPSCRHRPGRCRRLGWMGDDAERRPGDTGKPYQPLCSGTTVATVLFCISISISISISFSLSLDDVHRNTRPLVG